MRISVSGDEPTVASLPADGANADREFFTLFPDLDSIPTLNVDLLAGQAYPFNRPISLSRAFGEDRRIILCLRSTANCRSNHPGISPFDPPQHRLSMQNMLGLLD